MHGKRTMVVALLLAASLVLMSLVPRPARAGTDYTTPLIVAGAVAGVGALITIIAILGANSEDSRQLVSSGPLPRRSPDRQRVHLGTRCPATDGNLPLLCW